MTTNDILKMLQRQRNELDEKIRAVSHMDQKLTFEGGYVVGLEMAKLNIDEIFAAVAREKRQTLNLLKAIFSEEEGDRDDET